LTAEIADGWLPIFYAPAHDGTTARRWPKGSAGRRAPNSGGLRGDRLRTVIISDDVERAADFVRPSLGSTSEAWVPGT